MPFKGEWSFRLVVPPVLEILAPPVAYAIGYGKVADLTPLGQVEIVYSMTTEISTGHTRGDLLITTPNGDTLRTHLDGSAIPDPNSPPPPAQPILDIDQPGTVFGGHGHL